jgi:hypothetical protein
MSEPKRIQRKRTRGWRAPDGAINCCRPGVWGNPFIVSSKARPGSRSGCVYITVPTIEDAVECYRLMLVENRPDIIAKAQAELRGKTLMCFCKVGDPCHADILLKIANEPTQGQNNG